MKPLKLGSEVDAGSPVERWNRMHLSQIAPGAELRAVNGYYNPQRMWEARGLCGFWS